MNTNPNDVPSYSATAEQLNALFSRSTQQAVAEREARLRAARWPTEVEGVLVSIAREQAALRGRIEALETRCGFAEG